MSTGVFHGVLRPEGRNDGVAVRPGDRPISVRRRRLASPTGLSDRQLDSDRAGRATGHASYRWVNRDTWLLSEVSLESSFSYGVTVMVAVDPGIMAYRAYAMTNFSPNAIAYQGHWQDDSTLVFEGALDPGGSQRQRVIYEKGGDGKLRFRAEESHDGGANYFPDSELLLERQQASP